MKSDPRSLGFVLPGAFAPEGNEKMYLDFITRNQLIAPDTWKLFVRAFKENCDTWDLGWRGEYWGKMMRGGCLVYRCTGDRELYDALRDAVELMFTAQEEDGRISAYDREKEFMGWDMWARKYVLTGMQHFYDICSDEALRQRIVSCLIRHADCILEKVGPDGLDITKTSTHWYGVNSCSILEPIVRLYDMTGLKRYLDFARYILSTGGCEKGDLIALALEDRVMPYEYPEVKAYETMSFFEGALAYYEVTGEEKYLTAVLNFIRRVRETDITLIGCAGCTHELFDHSAVKQTEPAVTIMQETCVTVTWMRLNARLYLLTQDPVYMDSLERACVNALYGAVNIHGEMQAELTPDGRVMLPPLPFDSYSPLYVNRRGLGIGGLKRYPDGKYYGCCACIGAAGIGLGTLTKLLTGKDGIVCEPTLTGRASADINGTRVEISVKNDITLGERTVWTIETDADAAFGLSIRVPGWADSFRVECGGVSFPAQDGFVRIEREWHNGDQVLLTCSVSTRAVTLNGRTAYTFGPFVLARDEQKQPDDLEAPFSPVIKDGGLVWTRLPAQDDEALRLTLTTDRGEMLFTDYASCGRHWNREHALMTVWNNVL